MTISGIFFLIKATLFTSYRNRGSKGPQAYTFFKTLYETISKTSMNFCSIISQIKNFMNNFAKKSNFPEIFFYSNFFIMLDSNLTKKILDHKEETLRYVQ